MLLLVYVVILPHDIGWLDVALFHLQLLPFKDKVLCVCQTQHIVPVPDLVKSDES